MPSPNLARFGLGKEKYVERIKNFRQILGKNHLEVYKQSRNHIEDKCKGLTHQEQFNRKTFDQIISSNSAELELIIWSKVFLLNCS